MIAGNAMGRRAIYMYGALLPRNPQGGVNGGLGQTTSTGTATLIMPTDIVTKTGQKITVDGVEMVFQMTPGTEAPAEMNTYFPQFKAMWMAENATNTLHNLLTLRGAQVRDPLKWAQYLDETIDLYGAGHGSKVPEPPLADVGQRKDHRLLEKAARPVQVHPRPVGAAHEQGLHRLRDRRDDRVPAGARQVLAQPWLLRHLRHNSRAVYQRYMGWYDANPSDLNDLPPEPAAKKYVEYMGGEEAVLERAQADFDKGEYRWVAMALKHVVFANPNSVAGKNLLADTYEQLGYQAESGPWRSVYLQGALELRNGVPAAGGIDTASPDTISAMPPDMLFDYLAVRLNGAGGRR